MYSILQLVLREYSPFFLAGDGWWSVLFELKAWRPLGLLLLLAVVLMTLVGLLAIWSALGRGNWFLRVAVVLGCISLLWMIPAYELVVVYLIQTGLTIVVLAAWRNWRLSRRAAAVADAMEATAGLLGPWQFSIRDLLLLTVLVAWVSAMVTSAPATVWAQRTALLVEGLTLAVLTIAAAWIALSGCRWWVRLPVLLMLIPSALMTMWLLLWRRAHPSDTIAERKVRRIGVARVTIVVLSVVIIVPAIAVYWRFATPWPIPKTTAPNPNSYDDLIRAGKLLQSVTILVDIDAATHAQLKTYVAQCSSVYGPVRVALGKPCQAPSRLGDRDYKKSSAEPQTLNTIGYALYGLGRLAAMEDRQEDAIAAYLDTIRLGRASQRGGLIFDLIEGVVVQQRGNHGIAALRNSLSARECKQLLPTLSELLDKRPPAEECLAREAAWLDRVDGWQGRFAALRREMGDESEVVQRAVAHACDKNLAKSRLLICDLAIRTYLLDHGRNPAKLADLVPGYLPEVPEDPFGGEFVYRPTPTGYELRSAGIDSATGKPIALDEPK